MKIALLPLDERPANVRYPAQIAAIANAQLLLPPNSALPHLRQPAHRAALAQWLLQVSPACDGIVASIDLLGHGGLIASRTSQHSVSNILQAIEPLLALRTPSTPVFGFNVIQRISNANDNVEEPLFWGEFGTRLYEYSRVLDSAPTEPVLQRRYELEQDIPVAHRQAWLARRLRNHTVNMALLHAATQGAFDLLVIPSDDTAPIGLSARERKHLEAMCALVANAGANPILMYPGADDLGSALVARMVNQLLHHTPSVFVHYTDDAMRQNIAPYEDRPISAAVATQLMAVGARPTQDENEADVILVVSPPFERVNNQDPDWRATHPQERQAALRPAVQRAADWLRAGKAVAIADVAFPNGAEPALVELLFEQVDLSQLAAFGGWNTAGNTLGTVLGTACVPCLNKPAQQRALAHRLLEDWGYQSIVRDVLHRSPLSAQTSGWGAGEPVAQFTAQQLAPIAQRIRNAGLPCAMHHVRHPWGRTFEVDFELA